jgi:hypothetical protein
MSKLCRLYALLQDFTSRWRPPEEELPTTHI